MSGNLLDKVRSGPVTQSVDAVKTLLSFVGRASDPMPSDVTLDNGRMVLVLNNKKDAYYVTTPKSCSCPASVYNPGKPCKHSRKYFPQPKPVEEPTIDLRASLPGWRGPDGQRANGPVEAI